jgi:hypothetical protein
MGSWAKTIPIRNRSQNFEALPTLVYLANTSLRKQSPS